MLECATVANVAMNTPPCQDMSESPLLQRCRFFAGDWDAIRVAPGTGEQQPPPKDAPPPPSPSPPPSCLLDSADVILMSDTLYTEELSVKALQAIVRLLKRPSHTEKGGEAYVAAKRYYFGTGGSIAFFEGLVATCNSVGPRAFASSSTTTTTTTKHAEEEQDSAQDSSSPSDETHLKLHLEKLCVGMYVGKTIDENNPPV